MCCRNFENLAIPRIFGTSRPRLGALIRKVVDLKKLTYQCASPIVIRVFPVEFLFVHRRHAAAMAAPRLGPVLLLKSVQITERLSTAVEKALGPIATFRSKRSFEGKLDLESKLTTLLYRASTVIQYLLVQ